MIDTYLLLLLLCMAYIGVWLLTFVWLMMTPDTSFDDRYDKIILALALVFVPVAGLVAYLVWSARRRVDLNAHSIT